MGAFRDEEEPFRSSPLADAFWKAPESKWWDGYSGQETVVLTTSGLRDAPGRAPAPP